jgi:hypothetical protein
MKVRPVEFSDYVLLCSWWLAWGWAAPAPAMLPPTGYIVEVEGKPVLAGFLYQADSALGWVEWVIGNPAFRLERKQALPALLEAIAVEAKRRGIQALFTSSNHPGLIEGYKAAGFGITDQNVTHLIRRLS